jgi:hypothetical protein
MKPAVIVVACVISLLCSPVTAQSSSQQVIDNSSAKTAKPSAAKLRHLRGTVGPDGKTFTTGKDHKTWKVLNPEALKEHEGHHRMLSATVYPGKNCIQVVSVIGHDHLKMNDGVDLARNQSR